MTTLVVFYSRTGHTRTLAHQVANALHAEIEEIDDGVDRRGLFGYLKSVGEGWFRRRTDILPSFRDPAAFDLVVIGTPVWRASLSSPVRAYLCRHAATLPRVAFFCTMGGFGSDRVFRQMQEICGKAPLATLDRHERQLLTHDLADIVDEFAARLRESLTVQASHAHLHALST